MHRTDLLQKLEAYQPKHEEEKVYKQQIIEFVIHHPNCFERTLEIGHITASCWLINKDGSQALLTHHAKLNKWFQLGGHCDGDSDVLAVALKEAHEESGISDIKPVSNDIFDIDVHLIPASNKEQAHYHYDIRFLLQANNDNIIVSDESHDVRWFGNNRSELPTNSQAVLRMFSKWTSL